MKTKRNWTKAIVWSAMLLVTALIWTLIFKYIIL